MLRSFGVLVGAFKVGFKDILLICEGCEKKKDGNKLLTSDNNEVLIICFVFDIFNAEFRKCRLHTVNAFTQFPEDRAKCAPVARGTAARTTSNESVIFNHVCRANGRELAGIGLLQD